MSNTTSAPVIKLADLGKAPPFALSEAELQGLSKLQTKLDYMAMFGFRDQYRERWHKEVLGG